MSPCCHCQKGRRGRAKRYYSSLVPRCGVSALIPHASLVVLMCVGPWCWCIRLFMLVLIVRAVAPQSELSFCLFWLLMVAYFVNVCSYCHIHIHLIGARLYWRPGLIGTYCDTLLYFLYFCYIYNLVLT